MKARWYQSLRTLLNSHWLLLLGFNIAFFACVGLGMALRENNPSLEDDLMFHWRDYANGNALISWSLSNWWGKMYLLTVLAIALVNYFVGSLLYLSLPSLVIPGAALPMVLARGLIWGLLTPGEVGLSGGTILLEGEAYLLAALAALLHARTWLFPARLNVQGHKAGYRVGIGQHLTLQPIVVLQLFIAAMYESAVLILT